MSGTCLRDAACQTKRSCAGRLAVVVGAPRVRSSGLAQSHRSGRPSSGLVKIVGMRVRDLGPLTVEVDGRAAVLSGTKLTAILSMLVLHANQRVSTDSLVDAVWGAGGGPDRLPTLESHIWRLRRVLEPGRRRGEAPQILVNDDSGYRFVALPGQLDSARFERLNEDTREFSTLGDYLSVVRVADEALALWRGRPHRVVADHPSVAPLIARLTETYRQIAARRVDALLEIGDTTRALSDINPLIAESPLDEHLHATRIRALHQLGRTSEALQAYQDTRSVLRAEVGLEPGAELAELQRRMLNGDPVLVVARVPAARPAAARQAHLPTPLTPLLGRAAALDQLTSLVAERILVTVTGPAGCGKTRLAIEVARQAGRDFRDGTWFVDLSAVDEASLVADVVVSTLGIAAAGAGTAIDTVRAYCLDRSMLLVLDNCEHVLAAATVVAETVLGASQNCAVLATSREPLEVPGEILWTLAPLALPDSGSEQSADSARAPAVALFLERMHAARAGDEPREDELGLIVGICVELDGLPLAIELAAARVRSATLHEIATEVARDPSGLRRLGRGASGDRSTLRDSIETSHRLLTEPERAAHRRLAVLPGAFSRDTATSVLVPGNPADPIEPTDVPYLLESLVHRSMLTAVPPERAGGATLFRQLATVRGHALHVLRSGGEQHSAVQRRDAWVAGFVAQRPRIAHPDTAGWYLNAVDALPTIRATLQRFLVDKPAPDGTHLISRLPMLWYFHSRMAEGLRWTQLAELTASFDDVTPLVVQIAAAAGDAVRGRADLAVPRAEQALHRLAEIDVAEADPARLVDLGDLYAPLAIALGRSAPPPVLTRLSESAVHLSHATADDGLAVLGAALDCAAHAGLIDPRVSAARSASLYEQALEVGHLFAALVASGVAVALALACRDPRGRAWAERNYHLHRSQGGTQTGLLLEYSANFAAFDADPHTAVQLLAASRERARRAGTTWPRHPTTHDTRTELEHTLSADDFRRAWQDGLTLGSADDAADNLLPRTS